MRYMVKAIQDADFGCEERPTDYVAVVLVTLQDEGGDEIIKELPDAELYEKDINEGDWVFFDKENHIHKED